MKLPGAPVADQLAAELGDQPSLLVLDNCEHLVAACAELVADAAGGESVRVGAGHEP